MGEVQKYKDVIGQRVAAGKLDELAVDMLKAGAANNGSWSGLWSGVLDRLRELPPGTRKLLADGFSAAYHSDLAGPVSQENALTLLGVVAHGLPEDWLAAQRLEKLGELGRQHSFWSGSH